MLAGARLFFLKKIIFFVYKSYLVYEHPNPIFHIKITFQHFFPRPFDDLIIC